MRFAPTTLEQVEQLAERTGRSVSDVIRDAVDALIREEKCMS
ncbi:ribbon-helix-helix protein, CopG family [Rhodococcus hoagii]|nr:ribbon-helix-helix protein, CopG family [Prescottella equi]